MKFKILLIGNGRLAFSIAHHLQSISIGFDWYKADEIGSYFSKKDERPEATLYLIAINESRLIELLNEFSNLNPNSLYCHFSASIDFSKFPKVIKKNSLILHPLQSFPNKINPIKLDSIFFTFQGSKLVYKKLNNLFLVLKINTIIIEIKNAKAYHLMAIFVSNMQIALMKIATDLAKENNIDEVLAKKMLIPLIESTIHNISNNSLIDSLSGPLKRGETKLIKEHILYLNNFNKEYSEIYQKLNNVMLEMLNK
jgi:predicted short-subunit dehydrogenase-like oxidoreductase (DUF2520 family)